jgi:hypothetical protein
LSCRACSPPLENFNETKQSPAIVVLHLGGGVKEQTGSRFCGGGL